MISNAGSRKEKKKTDTIHVYKKEEIQPAGIPELPTDSSGIAKQPSKISIAAGGVVAMVATIW